MIVSVIGGTGPQGLGIAERLAIAGVEVIFCKYISVIYKEFLMFFNSAVL